VKGKAKAKGKAATGLSAQELELGEYGFDSSYNYAQHFKPMGVNGGVFMEAPVPKGTAKGKGQKQVTLSSLDCSLAVGSLAIPLSDGTGFRAARG
jgi:hypothetical protein